MKNLLIKATDPFLALLATPLPWCGRSPLELLMGRKANQEYKQRQKRDFDERHRVRDLPDIPANTDVPSAVIYLAISSTWLLADLIQERSCLGKGPCTSQRFNTLFQTAHTFTSIACIYISYARSRSLCACVAMPTIIIFVRKMFVIRSQITKFTKILCHKNLEVYGIHT